MIWLNAAVSSSVNLAAAVSLNRARRYLRHTLSLPPSVTAPTESPRGICADVENHRWDAGTWPKRGGLVTTPRLDSSEVSQNSGPAVRSSRRSSRRLTAAGHHGAASARISGSTCGPGWCLAQRVCAATSATTDCSS